MQLGGIAIDAKRAGAGESTSASPAAEQSDAEHSRPACREKVPHGVAHDVAVIDRHTEALLAVEKKIRRRFGAQHVTAFDHDRFRADSENLQRTVDLGPPS